MNKVFIYNTNNRCLENALDTGLIRHFFYENGWKIINNPKNADLILINTCAYNQFRENQSINIIKKYKKIKNESRILVCGCLSKINPARLKSIFEGKSFAPKELIKLNDIIKAKKNILTINNNALSRKDFRYSIKNRIMNLIRTSISPFSKLGRLGSKRIRSFQGLYAKNTFYIKVSNGCLGECSYCAIKKARGNIQSKPKNIIIREFKKGLGSGYKHFVLLGEDIGAYGLDVNSNIVELLNEMIKEKCDYKIGINNLNPNWLLKFSTDLIKIFKSGKISSVLIPIQSGNNRILKLMNRSYRIEDFEKIYNKVRNEAPYMMVNTHIMVGFPTETNSEFYDTFNILEKLKFDNVALFKYTDRPNTIASKMENKIPIKIINKRYNKLWSKYKYKDYVW